MNLIDAILSTPADIFGITKGLASGGKVYDINSKKITNINAPIMTGGIGSGAVSIWSGLSTTGKVLVGAGAGATGYAAYDWLFGSKKQATSQQQQASQKTVSNQFTYSPQSSTQTTITSQITNAQSYQYVIDSPYASISKKDAISGQAGPVNPNQTPSQTITPAQTITPEQAQGQAQGTDFTTIAVIAAVGLVAYGYTTRGKHGKK